MNKNDKLPDFNRRDFLKNTSLATAMALMGGVELRAENAPKPASTTAPMTEIPPEPDVTYGIIGLGARGRDIVTSLSQMKNAPILGICDSYEHAFKRPAEAAPKAEKYDDYKKLLANKDIKAVVVATPTHQHREIVLAAFDAGKHVYCEAPLAHTVEDTKAIATAAKAATKVVFQPGLQERSHPERVFLLPFMHTRACGKVAVVRGQLHKFSSWVQASPNPDREKELNWRLHQATSGGLLLEEGIHQLDAVSWFMKTRPLAVSGWGSIVHWNDGRDVPDTAQAVFEYPDGMRFIYDATLCNSFDHQYELYHGIYAAVMYRDDKAWMFKEADSPQYEWEVYCRRDNFYTNTGIALVADGSKQTALTNTATSSAYQFPPIYYSLKNFTSNVGRVSAAVDDYISLFGDTDPKALAEKLAALAREPAATWKEGLEATVMAIKANEAIVKNQRIVLQSDWFEI